MKARHSEKRRSIRNREVVLRNRLEDSVLVQAAQLSVAGGIAAEINPCFQRDEAIELLVVAGISSLHGAELRLPDQAIAEIRDQTQAVGAEKTGELQLLFLGDLPGVAHGRQGSMGAIGLSGINRVLWQAHINWS